MHFNCIISTISNIRLLVFYAMCIGSLHCMDSDMLFCHSNIISLVPYINEFWPRHVSIFSFFIRKKHVVEERYKWFDVSRANLKVSTTGAVSCFKCGTRFSVEAPFLQTGQWCIATRQGSDLRSDRAPDFLSSVAHFRKWVFSPRTFSISVSLKHCL